MKISGPSRYPSRSPASLVPARPVPHIRARKARPCVWSTSYATEQPTPVISLTLAASRKYVETKQTLIKKRLIVHLHFLHMHCLHCFAFFNTTILKMHFGEWSFGGSMYKDQGSRIKSYMIVSFLVLSFIFTFLFSRAFQARWLA